MSALTTEWVLKTGENSIEYVVEVSDFEKKMKTFRAGRAIWSKEFKVGRTVFDILIYPHGQNQENSDTVGVFVHNNSDWDVIAEVTFKVQNWKIDRMERFIGNGVGWGGYIEQRCVKYLLEDDGNFQLEVCIKLDCEEVLPQHDHEDDATYPLVQKMDEMEKRIDLRQKEMEERIDLRQKEMEERIDEKLDRINQHNSGFDGNENPAAKRVKRDLNCPICEETVEPPMRLQQCGKGHIICDDCQTKMTSPRCHSCRGPLTGRPSALERMCGLV